MSNKAKLESAIKQSGYSMTITYDDRGHIDQLLYNRSDGAPSYCEVHFGDPLSILNVTEIVEAIKECAKPQSEIDKEENKFYVHGTRERQKQFIIKKVNFTINVTGRAIQEMINAFPEDQELKNDTRVKIEALLNDL